MINCKTVKPHYATEAIFYFFTASVERKPQESRALCVRYDTLVFQYRLYEFNVSAVMFIA